MKKLWQWIASPPFYGLPWVVWLYALTCFMFLSKGGVFSGHIIGWDDQVRMVQVLNWVNGAGFYDRTIMRTNGPEGFTTIWSRIVDIPLALGVLIAQQFVTQKVAALISAAFVSIISLALLLVVAPYFARPLVGKKNARLIDLFLPFTSILNGKLTYFSISGFFLGQASHHSWYIILVLAMFGATARLAMGVRCRAPVVMLAISIALLLAVGIEGFPLIGCAAAVLSLVSWMDVRPQIARRGAQAFIYAALASLILLPMHQPPSHMFTTISFAEPSLLGPILLVTASFYLAAQYWLMTYKTYPHSSLGAMLVGIAGILGVMLVLAFPQILEGGAAGLSPAERQMALSEHFEARSVFIVAHDISALMSVLLPSLVAFIGGIYAFYTAPTTRRRAIRSCYFIFATTSFFMECLYSRYVHHALTTACAWLVWVWDAFNKRFSKDTNYGLKSFGVYFLLGPVSMLLIMAIFNNWPFTTFILLFPANMQVAVDECDSLPFANYLNDNYSKETNLLVPYWESAQFLYQTDIHIDFLANYPSHDKFIDHYAFLGATSESPDTARKIAREHGIDLVAVCMVPSIYRGYLPPQKQTLAALLQVGQAPKWLKEVPLPLQTKYRLYAVDKSGLGVQAP